MGDSKIHRDNLLIALYVAMTELEKREKAAGFSSNSALLSGLQENFTALEKGEKLTIKYD